MRKRNRDMEGRFEKERKLTPQLVVQIDAMVTEGLTIRVMAKRLNIPRSSVHRLVKERKRTPVEYRGAIAYETTTEGQPAGEQPSDPGFQPLPESTVRFIERCRRDIDSRISAFRGVLKEQAGAHPPEPLTGARKAQYDKYHQWAGEARERWIERHGG